MKKRLFATMLLFTGILSLTSCSKDDGDWDAMKWEKNNYEEALTPSFGKAIGCQNLAVHILSNARITRIFGLNTLMNRCVIKPLNTFLRMMTNFIPKLKAAIRLQRWKEIRSLLHLRQTKHRMDVMFV